MGNLDNKIEMRVNKWGNCRLCRTCSINHCSLL